MPSARERLRQTRRRVGRLRASLQEAARPEPATPAAAPDPRLALPAFYLPFPEIDRLPESLWSGQRPLHGIDLRLDAAAELLHQLSSYMSEPALDGYEFANGTYEWSDAQTLYGMLRHLEPSRVMELGSGASTHVIELARAVNEQEGSPFRHTTFDPFGGWHEMGVPDGMEIQPIPAEELDPAAVETLVAGDVLFVDTTHTVKTGGDVQHIILGLLPRLAPGVHVHFHDIFLPFDYPRQWVVQERRAWAEQYLLEAFLAFNSQFEVVLPLAALSREREADFRRAVPRHGAGGAGAFWIRCTG
ncbi:MAG TPA: class I SAM-dependent methyltransferase [Solirubrobacteraceae bacterium]|nr:class I SAM-dependent methyltransferase [Solirubrobacteraceae bacterium]